MRRSLRYVAGGHPRLLSARIESSHIHRQVGREDEAVNAICCGAKGARGHRLILLARRNIHRSTVGDVVEALDRINGETFVGIDVAGDAGEGESGHGERREKTLSIFARYSESAQAPHAANRPPGSAHEIQNTEGAPEPSPSTSPVRITPAAESACRDS